MCFSAKNQLQSLTTLSCLPFYQHHKRPSTTELLKIDRVRICVRERELNQMQVDLKRKEAELVRREEAVAAREAAITLREQQVMQVLPGTENEACEQLLYASLSFAAAKTLLSLFPATMQILETPREAASFPLSTRMSLGGSSGPRDLFNFSSIEGGTPATSSLSTPAVTREGTADSLPRPSPTIRLSQGSAEILDAMRSPDRVSFAAATSTKENRPVPLSGVRSVKMSPATATASPMPARFRGPSTTPSAAVTPAAGRLRAIPRHLQQAGGGTTSAAATPLSSLAKQMTKMTLASPMQMSP